MASSSSSPPFSSKSLWHLLSSSGGDPSCHRQVLEAQLLKSRHALTQGLLFYPSAADGKDTPTTAAPAKKTTPLSLFLQELGVLLGVPASASSSSSPMSAKAILTQYLSGDFRGTKQSLKQLIAQERYQRPLLHDVWHFYRAERLYLLQGLKAVLTHAANPAHPHREVFVDALDALNADGALYQSLVKQLRHLASTAPPSAASHGAHWTEALLRRWTHFHLREQAELLQILLLQLHGADEGEREKRRQSQLRELLALFQEQDFGHRQPWPASAHSEAAADLVEGLGQLQSLVLVYLVDLPGLTSPGRHAFWPEKAFVAELDKSIAGLGSRPEHGPVMLAWMLAHYLADATGEHSLAKYHALGEKAMQLRCVHFLGRATDSEIVCSHPIAADVAKGVGYGVLSVLVSAFDPGQMGVAAEAHQLMRGLLGQEMLAIDFWRQGQDAGLGTVFEAHLNNFPADPRPLLELCQDLASAGRQSADRVVACLEGLSVYAEPVELVPTTLLQSRGPDRWTLLHTRYPCALTREIALPAGTEGVTDSGGGGKYFRWVGCNYSGWTYLLAEVYRLVRQVSQGAKNVNEETLGNVVAATRLFDAVLRHSQRAMAALGQDVSKALFALVEKLVHVQSAPLDLLASCLRCLSLMARERPQERVWERLADTGLFPVQGRSLLGAPAEINPGLVGALLAQQECTSGEYPLTSAFLDLLLACVQSSKDVEAKQQQPLPQQQLQHPTTASVVYVVRDIFPSFQQWRFARAEEKQLYGQKMLQLCQTVLAGSGPADLRRLLCQTLLLPGPSRTLLGLVATGDRAVQSLIESQSSWETGAGVELASLVNLAMVVFEELLLKTPIDELNDLNRLLCSPPPAAAGGGGAHQPHFLLTVSHYIYHMQTPRLPISAVRLLSTLSRLFRVSLLTCMGPEAEAVRDALVYRLESRTDDPQLKVAIVDFFVACVDAQPGFVQLLIGAKQDVEVVAVEAKGKDGDAAATGGLSAEDKRKNASVALVGDHGCLKSILDLLKDSKKTLQSSSAAAAAAASSLHLSAVKFVLNLWLHRHVVAMEHLKKQPGFWPDLTWTLFDKEAVLTKAKLNACVLKTLSAEIFTYGGRVHDGLKAVLERLLDEKEGHFAAWNDMVLDGLAKRASSEGDDVNDDQTMAEENDVEDEDEDDQTVLLRAWKAFLLILARDQPVHISPGQCQRAASALIRSVRGQLSSAAMDMRSVTSVSELCLLLLQKWQTKCADQSMADWSERQVGLLHELARNFDHLHPRARAAVLGIANTALKITSFKLEKEEQALVPWLEPTAIIVLKSFQSLETNRQRARPSGSGQDLRYQVPILSLSLLRQLILRFAAAASPASVWFDVLHKQVLLQSVLSALHHSLRLQQQQSASASSSSSAADLVQTLLGLLLLIGRTDVGCRALLASDLAQMLWLPLSNVQTADDDWVPVFQLSLQLVTTLLRQGKHQAVENCVTVVALLQEQLTTFLLAPRLSLRRSHVDLCVTTAAFVGLFMGYQKQWQLQHPTTLVHFYHAMCSLLHVSVCLLVRPSLLGALISRSTAAAPASDADEDAAAAASTLLLQRVRRTSSTDQEILLEHSGSTPDAARVQNSLLDAVQAGLTMLRHLSPDLLELVSGNLYDPEAWEQLLAVQFSSPTFEQQDGGLSYGTLISVCNVCIRTITRGDRSPSPAARSPATAASTSPLKSSSSSATATRPGHAHLDRRRLTLVLEQSLTVLLSQALLAMVDPRCTPRERQLLRRELGSELGSLTVSMSRHLHRGTKSPLLGSPGGAAAGGGTEQQRLGKSDDQFMKFVASIVNNMFK